MTTFILQILIATQIFSLFFATEARIKRDDLQILTGAQWSGALTYLDYQSRKMISIPVNLSVKPNADDDSSWVFAYTYPDEPKANSEEIVRLSKDGRSLDGEVVLERTHLRDHTIRIVTEKKGQDDNRGASMRYTYLLNVSSFSITKEVRYEGDDKYFERNSYRWKR